MHRYLRYLYSFLYRKSVIYSKCFYRAFFEELGPFKVREPSAKGRRAAATKEEDEVGSNSSSNGSGVPGPAEKVTFLSKSLRHFFFQVALWLPTTSSREQSMDSSQKAKLLAQLKAIDGDSPYR